MELAIIDDKIIPLDEVQPCHLDRGVFFGDGVYEVLRSYDGYIWELDEHMARFDRSLKEIGIININIDDIRQKVLNAFDKADIPNCKIYFHITRGSAIRLHTWDDDMKPNFFLFIQTLPDASAMKNKGVAVCTYPDIRWKRCDIKSLNLLPNVMAEQHAKQNGCYESILVNDAGYITEGAGSAFFAIISGNLVTKPLGQDILPSITRKCVMKLANEINLPIKEHEITPNDAKNADELFMAVTTKDIMGIYEFDGTKISGGKVGPITRKLEEAFKKEVLKRKNNN